ncbi:MAG: protein-glutamate O-methyltransferase [Gemmatimonadaceae bacterium]|nr:protein-glutamate O-methyltransferase [Gemmatimonadaceae bacterium]
MAATLSAAGEVSLTAAEFTRVCAMLHEVAGIAMKPGKEGLVRSRLTKRVRACGHDSYTAYFDFVESRAGTAERVVMIDALTTNKTSFFREAAHFDLLRDVILPEHAQTGITLWSAGCSSGEEPYTLSMVLGEHLSAAARKHSRILATDLSHRVLERAKAGLYTREQFADVPPSLAQRWWTKRTEHGAELFEARPELRAGIRVARPNLMEPWPMRGPVDAILCRNVMIYFDKPTQQTLVQRYWELLRPGGHLFVGHSESLTGLSHRYTYVQPAVYRK